MQITYLSYLPTYEVGSSIIYILPFIFHHQSSSTIIFIQR